MIRSSISWSFVYLYGRRHGVSVARQLCRGVSWQRIMKITQRNSTCWARGVLLKPGPKTSTETSREQVKTLSVSPSNQWFSVIMCYCGVQPRAET